MYRGHYSVKSLLLPRLLERERVCVWVDGREMSRQGLAEFLHRAHVHTHNKVLQSWVVSLFDCSAHQSLDMGAGMSDTGSEVKWEKVGLESESLEVWKAMVESFPNNNAKLTQRFIAESVHCSLHAPLEFMRRRRRVWRSWRTMRGICTSQHAMVGQFAWRKIANLSNRRHQ